MNTSEHGWIHKVEVRSGRGTAYVPAGIVLWGVAVFIAATLFAAEGQPKDAGSRGKQTGAVRPEAAQLVTGSPEHLQSVVAGTPPTAVMKIVPVAAKVGSYPAGTTIVGNELRASAGGFRAWFEFKLSDWDPNGDNVPPLWVWQFKIDAYGYMGANADPSNPGVDLTPPVIACANNAPCVTAFGEAWATCLLGTGTCNAGYVDKAGTERPDSWCADTGSGPCIIGDCDMSTFNFRCFEVYAGGVGRPDVLPEYYGATVVLDIPAGAEGKYTVNLVTWETFMDDTANNDIPTFAETGFVVNIVPPPTCPADQNPPCQCIGTPGQELIESCHNTGPCPAPMGGKCAPVDTNGNGVPDSCRCVVGPCNDQDPPCQCVGTPDQELIESCHNTGPCPEPMGGKCAPVDTNGNGVPDSCRCVESTGACCDGDLPGGVCTDPVVGSSCVGSNQTFYKELTCAEVEILFGCPESTGACCDGDLPGGVCTENVVASSCVGTNKTFYKGVTCAYVQIMIGCTESTGACCDGTTGVCFSVPKSRCPTSEPQVRWEKGVSCADLNPPCTEHTGACCDGTSGTCVDNVPESQCPSPPGGMTAYAGPGPCSACGPGAHWADACPAGDDTMNSTGALVGISTDPDSCMPNTSMVLSGPVTVRRQAGSAHDIDTEIASMSLTGGNITLTAGAGQQQGPGLLPASLGMITELPPDFDEARSYFDVFFEVDLGGMFVYNQTALRIEDNITCVPPQAVYIHPTGCLPLFTPGGMHVANLVTARHITFPDQFRWEKGVSCAALNPPCTEHTGACCDGTTGVCNEVPESQCLTSDPQVRWEKGVSCAGLNPPCEPPPNDIIWDPTLNPVPWPNNNALATTRSLRFTVTGPGSPKLDAIKVTMIDLQHPIPPNLPQYPPPDLSAYEFGSCTAAGEAKGCARWVGKTGIFLESQDVGPSGGTYKASRLQCTPYYWDWKPEGLITVMGAEIVPSSEYTGQVYGAACAGAEAGCTAVSAPVTMYTRRSGDTAPNFNPPATSTQPDALDVAAVVNKLKNLPGALVKAITQLQPNVPELNADINALDIVAVVDGVKGKPYAFSGPCACPSTVRCGGACGAPCPAPNLCVKTCTGGTNDGQPCINNTHCPGGGTCGTPFCRDRCGRCTP